MSMITLTTREREVLHSSLFFIIVVLNSQTDAKVGNGKLEDLLFDIGSDSVAKSSNLNHN